MPATLLRFGADLLVRATSGICDRSRLNAELAGAVFAARRQEWTDVLSMYEKQAPRLAETAERDPQLVA